MKVCPTCQKKYDDVTLNFCLDDGSVLNDSGSLSNEPPPTVAMGDVPDTQAHQPDVTSQTKQVWDTPPRYKSSAASGSKSWLWALGVIGAIVVLCGGGFIGLAAIGVLVGEDDTPVPEMPKQTPPPRKSRNLVSSHNFSKWNVQSKDGITANYENRELALGTRPGYFYVLLTKGYITQDATVKLSVRNINGTTGSLGYGLVFHSAPLVLSNDHAFVIRTDTQQYRIVRHNNRREIVVVEWTKSTAINTGSNSNDLEVVSDGTSTSFYINGQFVRTEEQLPGPKNGVAGIYTSGSSPIGFSYMEYRK